MDTLLYWFARALVAVIQALPLISSRALGARAAGWLSGSTRGTGAWHCKI